MQIVGGTASIYYSTFAANTSTSGWGGGINEYNSGGVNIQSSIFSDNTSMYGGDDLDGNIVSLGYNVFENHSIATTHGTDSLSIDAGLAALTQDATSGQYVHTLNTSSAAIGMGGGTTPSTDIRAFSRGSDPDSGSYEANAAPVLSTAPAVTLTSVNEDAGVPSGTVGTLVSSIVDASGGGGWDNVSDSDGTTNLGIAITAASTTDGTWYYTTDGGANWVALGTVSGASSRLLAADANTRLYFRPTTANYNGTIASGITFRAWDQSTGTNGGTSSTTTNGGTTAFSSNSDTASITVNAVNDAPVNTIGSGWTVNEDSTLALTGLSIADADAASSTMTVTLSVSNGSIAATTGGSVTVSGSGTANIVLSGTAANINTFLAGASKPVFTPQNDFNGPVLLTMTTSDGGNTGSGGTLTDTDTATITVTVVADITNDSTSTNEDNSVTISVLGNDSFENSGKFISAVNGTAITAGGAAVNVTGGSVTLNGSGQLIFTPTANYNGAPSFTYTVSTFGAVRSTTTFMMEFLREALWRTSPPPVVRRERSQISM